MRIYLSAGWSGRDSVKELAKQLEERGHKVTSSWLEEPPLRPGNRHKEWEYRVRGLEDKNDVMRSEAIVLLTEWPSSSGGRHAEFAYADAWGKRLIVVGERENIFQYNPEVEHYNSWDEFLEVLDG